MQIKETDEIIPIIIIFGLIFPSLAWLLTRKFKTDYKTKSTRTNEGYLIVAFTVYIGITIILGNKIFFISDYQGIIEEIITLLRKVIVFVAIPFIVYKLIYRFSLEDFGLTLKWNAIVNYRSLTIWIVFSALLVSLNYFAGSGAKPLREGVFSTGQILKALPLLFLWLFIEVGLVEEFFFRGLLQNRLSAFLRSSTGGILISALIFGLVHAPGMYLRQAGINDGIGAEPSLLNSVVYCIAVQSVPGLFLGILWHRTRNLWLLMGIHAMFDLMPGLPEFINIWGL